MNNKTNRDVYITKSTLNHLSKNFDLKGHLSLIEKLSEFNFNFNFDEIFSTRELLSMNSVKILLNSSNNENIRFDIETNKRFINKKSRLIYLPNKPSYHYDENCKYLNSDYHNYDIPLEIRDEDIEKYREFFLENIDLFNDYPDRFYARVEIKFRTKIRNINTLNSKNTGITKISKYEHIELINKIKSELDEIKSDNHKDFINNIYIPYMKVVEIQKKIRKRSKRYYRFKFK
jgi:hypothetical protein